VQRKLEAFFRLCLLCTASASGVLPIHSLADSCNLLRVTERGAGPDSSSAMPLYPRITIEAPGRYCLARDVQQGSLWDSLRQTQVFAREEAVIRIRSSGVTLDLGGHSVANVMQKGMTAIWFSKFAPGERGGARLRNASILNGRLFSPFASGIGIDLTASKPYGPGSLHIASVPAGSSYMMFLRTRATY
jgi:hypothetical protein